MSPGGTRLFCMTYSSGTCLLGWICALQILHQPLATAGEELDDLLIDHDLSGVRWSVNRSWSVRGGNPFSYCEYHPFLFLVVSPEKLGYLLVTRVKWLMIGYSWERDFVIEKPFPYVQQFFFFCTALTDPEYVQGPFVHQYYLVGCFAMYQIVLGVKTCNCCCETDELPPTKGQPNPRKNRLKEVAFGPLFPTEKYFFVGWDWFYIGNRIQETQPNQFFRTLFLLFYGEP